MRLTTSFVRYTVVAFLSFATLKCGSACEKAGQTQGTAARAQIGDAPPDIAALYVDGDGFSFSQTDGKYLVLVFWSPDDCAHGSLLRTLDRIHRDYEGCNHFQILAICVDSDWDEWISYYNDLKKSRDPVRAEEWNELLLIQDEGEEFKDMPLGATGTPMIHVIAPDRTFAAVNIPRRKLASVLQTLPIQETTRQ